MTATKIIINCATGERQEIPLTEEELAQSEADQLAYEQKEAERLAEEEAKAEAQASATSKLVALGLTAEEIAALKG
jgi:hypothetical protein